MMSSRRQHGRYPAGVQHIRGVTLIELMVSLVIGLFLILGATTIYVNSRKSADVDDSIARLQETARYALSVIETDARMSNYWGLTQDGRATGNKKSQSSSTGSDTPANTLAPALDSDCGQDYAVDVENPIAASNNSFGLGSTSSSSSSTSSSSSSTSDCAAKTGAVANSDSLTVRRASTDVSAIDANKLQVCTTQASMGIILGGACDGELHDLITTGYYVDQQSDGRTDVPSLRRLRLISGPQFRDDEIVAGIEDMQIQFGVSANPTSGQAVQYVNAGDAALATGQIVAVKVWLMARAENRDGAFTDSKTYSYGDRVSYQPNDNYRRFLVSRTIYLRNVYGAGIAP